MKGYFFHITKENWGEEIKLKPLSFGYNRGMDEGDDSRICVSTTPWHCCIALGELASNDKLNVYRTKNAVTAIKPSQVEDRKVTEEYWLVRPTTFIKIDSISTEEGEELWTLLDEMMPFSYSLGESSGVPYQKRALPKIRKFFEGRGWVQK